MYVDSISLMKISQNSKVEAMKLVCETCFFLLISFSEFSTVSRTLLNSS